MCICIFHACGFAKCHLWQCIDMNPDSFRWKCERREITCDQTPTVHRGAWVSCVGVCLISSLHSVISHTSLVGRILGSIQALSAILITNVGLTSCTHSSSRVRTPMPQEVEHSLHGPARHLREHTCRFSCRLLIRLLILCPTSLPSPKRSIFFNWMICMKNVSVDCFLKIGAVVKF